MKDRVLFHEYGTQLRMEGDDKLVLNVVCGRVAEYMVEFVLSSEECAKYRARGDSYIVELAREVQETPKAFKR